MRAFCRARTGAADRARPPDDAHRAAHVSRSARRKLGVVAAPLHAGRRRGRRDPHSGVRVDASICVARRGRASPPVIPHGPPLSRSGHSNRHATASRLRRCRPDHDVHRFRARWANDARNARRRAPTTLPRTSRLAIDASHAAVLASCHVVDRQRGAAKGGCAGVDWGRRFASGSGMEGMTTAPRSLGAAISAPEGRGPGWAQGRRDGQPFRSGALDSGAVARSPLRRQAVCRRGFGRCTPATGTRRVSRSRRRPVRARRAWRTRDARPTRAARRGSRRLRPGGVREAPRGTPSTLHPRRRLLELDEARCEARRSRPPTREPAARNRAALRGGGGTIGLRPRGRLRSLGAPGSGSRCRRSVTGSARTPLQPLLLAGQAGRRRRDHAPNQRRGGIHLTGPHGSLSGS